MTVNSRPLYRLSYRGVLRFSARAGTTFDIRASMGNQVFIAQPDIIAGDRRYESNRIAAGLLSRSFGALQGFVLHRAHRLDRLGDEPGWKHTGQAGKNRVGVERRVGLENAP